MPTSSVNGLSFAAGGGKVTTDFGGSDYGRQVVVQPDGKILVAGGSDNDFAVARYHADGTLDLGFSGDGFVTTDTAGIQEWGESLTLLASGKILVAGTAYNDSNNGYNFALVRYNADGTLDTSFAGDGTLTTDFGGTHDLGYSVAVQSDGRVLVAGRSDSDGSNFALARYNVNGTLDKSFSGDGRVTTTFGGSVGQSLVLQSDGKILVAGYSAVSGEWSFALARFNVDGSLDTGFGDGGLVTTDIGDWSYGYSVVLQADGKVLVTGYSYISGDWDFALARYNPNGSLDSSFGDHGLVTTDFGGGDYGCSVTLQADGKILVAGYNYTDFTTGDFALARYNPDGTPDTSFDGDGRLTTDFGGREFGDSVTVQPDGKILVAGTSDNNFALARYNPDGSLDAAPSNTDPSLDTPTPARYTDTAADDSFTVTRGTLSATDADPGTTLTYGLTDATLSAGVATKTGTYGTLRVTTATGAYSFTPNDRTIEALKANATETYTVSVSDGTASATAPFVVNLTGANDRPRGTLTITGTPTPGATLTATSTLSDAEGLGTLSYRWLADGTAIPNATRATLTLDQSHAGRSISVRAGYTDGRGTAEAVTSAPVQVVAAAGVTLTARNGTITREDGSSIDFAVRLDKAPSRTVTLTFSSSDATEGRVATAPLTFTAANWNTPQTLRVTGVQDYLNDGTVAYAVSTAITTDDTVYADYARRGGIAALQLTNAPDVTLGVPGYADGIDRDVPQFLRPGTGTSDDNDSGIVGLDGPDRIYGGYGMDDLSGGIGDDRLYGQEDDDRLFGEDGNDQLWGGYDDDTLSGGAGDDRLYGEQGDDRLEGGTGNDTLDGGLGTDTLIGGAGNDTYYLGYDAADRIDDRGLATDLDTVIMPYVMTSYTLPTGIENGSIAAGTAASRLTGNSAGNRLTGNDGANTLSGAAGTDTLLGGNGNDRCDGGTGNDTLSGGTGNDVLLGGLGTDTASGGAGADVFKFVLRTEGADTLSDFVSGTDKLQVVGPNFGLTPGATPRFVTAVSQVTGTTPVFIYTQSTGALVFDSNGTGAGGTTTLANLRAGTALRVGDIQVVAA